MPDPSRVRGTHRGAPLSRDDERRRQAERRPGRHLRATAPTAPPVPAGSGSASAEPAAPGSYRPELQGLRAVAILMVVCYHIWFGRVSGGVDIFLLISAFLLTGSFARKLERGTPLRVPRYWLHAFKRLVPPGALVILAVLAGVLLLLPATRWRELLTEAVASLTYWENWLLAAKSVDYYAADHSTASPLQHYWSLSIQGQVFFLWPLLFALAALIIRRFRLPVRPVLLVLFGSITLASLAWSIHETATAQAFAYFDTRTRLWEFSLGSVLALVLPMIETRLGYRRRADGVGERLRAPRAVAGWVGIALILSCGLLIDVQGAFPGYIALWPTLASCLVIAAGPTHTTWGVDRLLSSRPLQWLGDISYALYLVHWPLLIFALVVLGRTALGVPEGTVLVAGAIVLAWLLTRFVDSPIRRSPWLEARWWRSATAIAVSCALVLGAVGTVRAVLERQDAKIEAQSAADNPGARALRADYVDRSSDAAEPIPTLADLPHDWYAGAHPCSGRFAPEDESVARECSIIAVGDSDRVLVVVGDSRDEQYAPGLVTDAVEQGWTVVLILTGGCPYIQDASFNAGCTGLGDAREAYIDAIQPDAVASSYSIVTKEFEEIASPGVSERFQHLVDQGISVITYRDMPRLPPEYKGCIESGESSEVCAIDVSEQYLGMPPLPAVETDGDTGRLTAFDPTDLICPGRTCRPVIGNVRVWMDPDHISATYAATMSSSVTEQLEANGWSWR